jgi:hypothetical protein
MGNTGVDEARLFHSRNDLDGVTEGFAGTFQKRLLTVRESEGVRPDDTNAVGVYVPQTLPESLQACESSCSDLFVDATVLLDTGSEPHHLAQAVNNNELTVRIPRDDHVEAV